MQYKESQSELAIITVECKINAGVFPSDIALNVRPALARGGTAPGKPRRLNPPQPPQWDKGAPNSLQCGEDKCVWGRTGRSWTNYLIATIYEPL